MTKNARKYFISHPHVLRPLTLSFELNPHRIALR
jgi:hypothetical protein